VAKDEHNSPTNKNTYSLSIPRTNSKTCETAQTIKTAKLRNLRLLAISSGIGSFLGSLHTTSPSPSILRYYIFYIKNDEDIY